MRLDAHVHTNISDSSLSTKETLELAKRRGLTHLALTNHDTVHGLSQAIELGKTIGIEVIPGIEMSAYHDLSNRKVHLLGYHFKLEAPHIKALCDPLNAARDANTRAQLQLLIEAGYPITLAAVEQRAAQSTAVYKQHLTDVLLKNGLSRDEIRPLFKKGGLCDQSITYLDAVEAVKAIKADGGVAVLAHPGQSKAFGVVPALVAAGLDGIEAYHPDHSEDDIEQALALAKQYGLFVTTGSDFHADYGPKRPFGDWVMTSNPFETTHKR